MQQRQLRLGDILDDYCPRERRVTNHAVVAMVGPEVKQTRCTTCEAEHEYKHAKVPRQRRKTETPGGLYSQVLAGGPKRLRDNSHPDATNGAPAVDYHDEHEPAHEHGAHQEEPIEAAGGEPDATTPLESGEPAFAAESADGEPTEGEAGRDEGPVHRPLIRASLPRPEGQAPPARPLPEFTIRQPGNGRPNRFRPRHQRGGQQAQFGNRSNGNMGGGSMRGGMPRHSGGNRPPLGAKRHHGGGRKRSK